MSYQSGEALVLTQLRNVSGFTSDNTARGKWNLLNSGKSDHYGIIKPGAFRLSDRSQIGTIWRTIIQVWYRYKDDGTTLENLEALADATILRFRQYRKLGDTTGTISDSTVAEGADVQEMWNKGANGPAWLMWPITVEWSEENHVTYQE